MILQLKQRIIGFPIGDLLFRTYIFPGHPLFFNQYPHLVDLSELWHYIGDEHLLKLAELTVVKIESANDFLSKQNLIIDLNQIKQILFIGDGGNKWLQPET